MAKNIIMSFSNNYIGREKTTGHRQQFHNNLLRFYLYIVTFIFDVNFKVSLRMVLPRNYPWSQLPIILLSELPTFGIINPISWNSQLIANCDLKCSKLPTFTFRITNVLGYGLRVREVVSVKIPIKNLEFTNIAITNTNIYGS